MEADLSDNSISPLRPDIDALNSYELWYDKDGRIAGYHKETEKEFDVSRGNAPPDGVCAAFLAKYPPGKDSCYPWVPDEAAIAIRRGADRRFNGLYARAAASPGGAIPR